MEGENVHSIMDDPLAGCLALMRHYSNGDTMADSLLLRLQLFHNKLICAKIYLQLQTEVLEVQVYKWEYIVNELQYEMRRAKRDFDTNYEAVLLNSWSHHLKKVEHFKDDQVLDFISSLKTNREQRSRN